MKNNKALKNFLIIFGLILGVAILVLYVIFPNQFKNFMNQAWALVNEPLPVVGVSALVLGIFALKMVKYIRNTKPSQELREMREKHNEYVAKSEEEKQALKDQNAELKGYIAHICELSTNQKIKNYGKELLGHGEEETDVEPKAKEM